jgi:hypothetical protein
MVSVVPVATVMRGGDQPVVAFGLSDLHAAAPTAVLAGAQNNPHMGIDCPSGSLVAVVFAVSEMSAAAIWLDMASIEAVIAALAKSAWTVSLKLIALLPKL